MTRTSAAATRELEGTQNAQATIDTQLTAIATEEPVATQVAQGATEQPDETEGTPRPSATPRGTLVPIEAESQAADLSNQAIPILIVIIVIVVLLALIYLLARGRRTP